MLMVKKGNIEEIFSKALYADNPLDYTVIYRDFENFKHDEERKKFLHLKEQSIQSVLLIKGTKV